MVQLYTSEVVATIVSVAVEHHAEAHLRLRLTANDPFGHLYGAPFSHLFTELKISPIEVHISAIQLQISPIQLKISPNQLKISTNRPI